MEYLILNRVYVVLALLFEKLGDFLKDPDFPDVEEALAFQELDMRYTLTNDWVV